MSLIKLAEYLSTLYFLATLLRHPGVTKPQHAQAIRTAERVFTLIRKSDALLRLKPSYEEEELLVTLSL